MCDIKNLRGTNLSYLSITSKLKSYLLNGYLEARILALVRKLNSD